MPAFLSLRRLAVALSLGACGLATAAETENAAFAHRIDWPKHGIGATLEYSSLAGDQSRPACVGKIHVENYGTRTYSVLLFNVTIYSASRELIATDRFSLSSSLNPGGKAEIPYDLRNPLNPIVATARFSECPKDMRWARVILDAF